MHIDWMLVVTIAVPIVTLYLPGGILDLPPGRPDRFFAAQIILYGGLASIVLAWVLR